VNGFSPKAIEKLTVERNLERAGNFESIVKKDVPLKATTFNIGYCGLDRNQDFFMDGGKGSRSSSKEQTLTNLRNITNAFLLEEPNFILIQEADVRSTRSYYINQKESLQTDLAGYSSTFGLNYKVSWVPAPFLHPMGSVYSGLLTFSQYKSNSVVRFQYPGSEKWPRQMFDLERCFIENRLPVEGGKELLLINSHLSAYDEGGKIRQQQLDYLSKYIVEQYAQKGNYVIVGGDWNHILPGTDPALFESVEQQPFWLQKMPDDFTPEGFKWAVDRYVPTVRTIAAPYQKDFNFLAVIDGFLVSPNVYIQKVKGHNLDFENSDHNPVSCTFILK
jgi:endonuclease/exonuclease/phosphatase family metal-dependent hydrolase